MSSILYYSNFCENCKTLLGMVANSEIKNDMHFICVDNRIKKNNGSTYIILKNNQEILMPPTITKVPALLLLNRGQQVIFGRDILNHLQVTIKQINEINNSQPSPFTLSGNNHGIVSDKYSFVNQIGNELDGKNNGGLKQLHHYRNINQRPQGIDTPSDNYVSDRKSTMSLEELKKKRNMDINN